MALDSARGIMNCGTGERVEKAGRIGRAGTGRTGGTGGTSETSGTSGTSETSETGGRIGRAGTGETSGTGREFLNMNFELGISCKLALVGGEEGFDNDTNTNNLAEKFNTCN